MASNQASENPLDDLTIYTIGHGNASFEKICDLLKTNHIDLLVDVRSAPYSRYVPDFNREPFSRRLQAAGIGYSFAGEKLGGRPTDASLYKDKIIPDGNIDKAKYLKLVDYDEVEKREFYQEGIKRLIELAHDHTLAIMCSEENPDQCHRSHLITRTLLKMSIHVQHIRQDGSIIAAELPSKQSEEWSQQLELMFDASLPHEPHEIEGESPLTAAEEQFEADSLPVKSEVGKQIARPRIPHPKRQSRRKRAEDPGQLALPLEDH
jgi:hypothetical protein